MNKQESREVMLARMVYEELFEQVLPQAAILVLDIGLVNEIGLLCGEIIRESEKGIKC